MSQVNRLEVPFSVEDFGHRFKQVHACLTVELDGCGLASTVHEAEGYRRTLAVKDGLVDGHARLFIRVRDDEVEVLNVVLLSS